MTFRGFYVARRLFFHRNEKQRQRPGNRHDARGDEESCVPERLLQNAGENPGEGDEQSAQARADRVMTCRESIALRDIHEVDEISGEAEAVAAGFGESDRIKPKMVLRPLPGD